MLVFASPFGLCVRNRIVRSIKCEQLVEVTEVKISSSAAVAMCNFLLVCRLWRKRRIGTGICEHVMVSWLLPRRRWRRLKRSYDGLDPLSQLSAAIEAGWKFDREIPGMESVDCQQVSFSFAHQSSAGIFLFTSIPFWLFICLNKNFPETVLRR